MKLKNGFMLREIAGSWIIVPMGEKVIEFNGLMMISESGALLWDKLEKGSDMDGLLTTLLREYNIDENTARNDIQEFIYEIRGKNLLEE